MKTKIIMLQGLMLCLFLLNTKAQPNYFVTHFDQPFGKVLPDTGGWASIDFSNKELFAKTDSMGPNPYPYQCVHFWWGEDWGIKIKDNPFMKFKAKRTTPGLQSIILNFRMERTIGDRITKKKVYKISLTTAYQDFFYDLSTDIASLETTNPGYKVINANELEFQLTPLHDDGLYLDDLLMGDSANPCTTKRPMIKEFPFLTTLDFSMSDTLEYTMSGISDGNSWTNGPVYISAVSSDPSIIQDPIVIYTGSDSTGKLVFVPSQPKKSGSVFIYITLLNSASCNTKTTKAMALKIKTEQPIEILSDSKSFSTELEVYPNPVSDIVNVSIPWIESRVSLFDLNGVLIIQKQVSDSQIQLNMTDMSAGLYILKVNSSKGNSEFKIIKQ